MGTKFFNQIGFGHATVFHHIMQKRRHQSLAVELPFCALQCHSNRMGDVRLAASAGNAKVRLISKAVGAFDLIYALRANVIKFGLQHSKACSCGIAGWRCGMEGFFGGNHRLVL